MKTTLLFFAVLIGFAHAESTSNTFSAVVLHLHELEKEAEFEAGLTLVDASQDHFKEDADQAAVLDSIAERLRQKRMRAIDLQAAAKALASNRSGTLEEAQLSMLAGQDIGRDYLRKVLRSGSEGEVEAVAPLLVEFKDPYAGPLLVKRLQSSPDWSVFLVPLIDQVKTQLTASHLSILISAAQANNQLHPELVTLTLDVTENFAGLPPLRPDQPVKAGKPGVKVAWGELHRHLPVQQQEELVRFLIRILMEKKEPVDADRADRVRTMLVESHLPYAVQAILRQVSQDLPEAEMKQWTAMLTEMQDAIDLSAITALAGFASRPSPVQVEAGTLLVHTLVRHSYPGVAPDFRSGQKIPAEVVSLSSRLDPATHAAVIRACLAVIEHQGFGEEKTQVALIKQIEEFLLFTRFPAYADLLVAEFIRDTKRPVSNRHVALLTRIPDQLRGLNPHQENNLTQHLFAWGELHAGKEEDKALLGAAVKMMVASNLPATPGHFAGKLLQVPPGPYADWLEQLLTPMALECDSATLRTLASHAANQGTQSIPAVRILITHIERLVWEPDAPPARLRAGQTRLEKTVTRLQPGVFNELTKGLTHVVQVLTVDPAQAGDDTLLLPRVEAVLIESKLPGTATHLADLFNADTKNPTTMVCLDLLSKLGPQRLQELDEGRQASLVNALCQYAQHNATTQGESEAKSSLSKASRLLQVAKFERTGEWLAAKLPELTAAQALEWGMKAIASAPDYTHPTTMRVLSEKARTGTGPFQAAIANTLTGALEHSRVETHPQDLVALLEALSLKPTPGATDTKVQARLEAILVKTRLPHTALQLTDGFLADPKRTNAETTLRVLGQLGQPTLHQLDESRQSRLVQAITQYVQLNATEDTAKHARLGVASKLIQAAKFPRTAEWLIARLPDLSTQKGVDLVMKEIPAAADAISRATLIGLAAKVQVEGLYQLPCASALIAAMEKITSGRHPEDLKFLLKSDLQDPVLKALVHAVQLYHQSMAATDPKAKEYNLYRRDLQRVEALLVACRLPQVRTLLEAAIRKDSQTDRVTPYMKLLGKIIDQLYGIDDGQQNQLLESMLAVATPRLAADAAGPDKNLAAQASKVLSQSRIPTLSVKMAEKLKGMEQGTQADWLVRALKQVALPLDDPALSSLASLVEVGKKNDTQALSILLDHVMRTAGDTTRENTSVLVAPDVQVAMERALRAYLKRTLSKGDAPAAPEATEIARAKKMLIEARLPKVTDNVVTDWNADPTGKAATTWIEILSKNPEALRSLSDALQVRLCATMIKVLGTIDPKQAESVKKLMRIDLLPPLFAAMVKEIAKAPQSTLSENLVGILYSQATVLPGQPTHVRVQLADGLVAVMEARMDQATLQTHAGKILSGATPSQAQLPQKLLHKLAAKPTPEKATLYVKLLRQLSGHFDAGTLKELTRLADTESPHQQQLKSLVIHTKAHMPNS